MTLVLQGMGDFRKAVKASNVAVIAAGRETINDTAKVVSRESMELVPFDTGALMRSQVVKFAPANKNVAVASISYGGPGAPYAVVQHENPKLSHPPKPPGKRKVGKHQGRGPTSPGTGRPQGSPKYLEYPLKKQHGKAFEARFIKNVNKFLKQYGKGMGSVT